MKTVIDFKRPLKSTPIIIIQWLIDERIRKSIVDNVLLVLIDEKLTRNEC